MQSQDIIYDLKGLSDYCPGLTVSALRGYIKSGKLPCYKMKGKILIRKSEFDRWLEDYRFNRKQDIKTVAHEALTQIKAKV